MIDATNNPNEWRILASLGHPRSLMGLALELIIRDKASPLAGERISAETLNVINECLRNTLIPEGYVKSLGMFVDVREVVEAVRNNDDVAGMPDEKEMQFIERFGAAPRSQELLSGEVFALTDAGLELLAGPADQRVIGGVHATDGELKPWMTKDAAEELGEEWIDPEVRADVSQMASLEGEGTVKTSDK